jgi:hypothetical protein
MPGMAVPTAIGTYEEAFLACQLLLGRCKEQFVEFTRFGLVGQSGSITAHPLEIVGTLEEFLALEGQAIDFEARLTSLDRDHEQNCFVHRVLLITDFEFDIFQKRGIARKEGSQFNESDGLRSR